MRFKEASVRGEFAKWTLMFEPASSYRGLLPQSRCTKCQQYVDQDKLLDHLLELHKYDVEDGQVIQVDNKWWRYRGTKAQV